MESLFCDSKRGGASNGLCNEIEMNWSSGLFSPSLFRLSELHYIIASLPIDLFLLRPGDYKMRASDLNTRDMRREGRKTFDLSDFSDE